MHFGKLGRGEVMASICGLVLAFSVFLDWYATEKTDQYSEINGKANVVMSAWQTQSILRYLFLAAAVAPLILAYVVIRDHNLSWPRGELTAVVSVVAIVLILVAGFVHKPGSPADTIHLQWGWILALVAAIGMLLGAVQRTAESTKRRKPPGTL